MTISNLESRKWLGLRVPVNPLVPQPASICSTLWITQHHHYHPRFLVGFPSVIIIIIIIISSSSPIKSNQTTTPSLKSPCFFLCRRRTNTCSFVLSSGIFAHAPQSLFNDEDTVLKYYSSATKSPLSDLSSSSITTAMDGDTIPSSQW